jgi:hypothetical protein
MPGKIEGRASNFAQVDSKTCGSGNANSIHVPRSASAILFRRKVLQRLVISLDVRTTAEEESPWLSAD